VVLVLGSWFRDVPGPEGPDLRRWIQGPEGPCSLQENGFVLSTNQAQASKARPRVLGTWLRAYSGDIFHAPPEEIAGL